MDRIILLILPRHSVVFLLSLLACGTQANPIPSLGTFPLVPWYIQSREPFDGAPLSAPFCADFDADGDKDCMVGSGSGHVEYWENTGSSSAFVFEEKTLFVVDGTSVDYALAVGANAKPWCGDMDGDGDLDCLVGSADGAVAYFVNEGDANSFDFRQEQDNIFKSATESYYNAATSRHGSLVGPSTMLAVAVTASSIFAALPAPFQLPGVDAAKNKVGTYASPFCYDIDSDGDLDCLVGTFEGQTYLFRNTGSNTDLKFKLEAVDIFHSQVTLPDASFASPFCFDVVDAAPFNGCLVGTDYGAVAAYAGGGINGTNDDNQNNDEFLPINNFARISEDVFNSTTIIDGSASPWCFHIDSNSNSECFVGSLLGDVTVFDTDLPDPTSLPTVVPTPRPTATRYPTTSPTLTTQPTLPPTSYPSPAPSESPGPSGVPTIKPTSDQQLSSGHSGPDAASVGPLLIAVLVMLSVVLAVICYSHCRKKQELTRNSMAPNPAMFAYADTQMGGSSVEMGMTYNPAIDKRKVPVMAESVSIEMSHGQIPIATPAPQVGGFQNPAGSSGDFSSGYSSGAGGGGVGGGSGGGVDDGNYAGSFAARVAQEQRKMQHAAAESTSTPTGGFSVPQQSSQLQQKWHVADTSSAPGRQENDIPEQWS